MKLEDVQKHWTAFGETDPMWAIMSDPDKRNGRWDLDDFFRTGENHIAGTFRQLDEWGIPVRRGKALDFGCGVGRLTQPLGDRFEVTYGVDISAPMLEGARKYNRHGDRCRYVLNTKNDLEIFEDDTFDFIFTTVVLQHMPPELAKNYIREFVRVLAPGGVLFFQVPVEQVAAAADPAPEAPAAPASAPAPARRPITASAAALPDSGFRADLFVLIPPVVLETGASETVHVEVQNLGDVTWPALGDPAAGDGRARINLANHWLDGDGNMVVHDDVRNHLPHDVEPGQTVTIPITVRAPGAPGSYFLELDMVQEYVAWFQSKGSRTARIKVRVAPPAEAFRARIEMHGIPQHEVVALVESGGGKVLRQAEYMMVDWKSVDYYATK